MSADTNPIDQELQKRIAKLPGWAREHINDLQRQRDSAIDQMKRMADDTTPSPFSVTEYFSEGAGKHLWLRRYIDAHKIDVAVDGVFLTVRIGESRVRGENDEVVTVQTIELQWRGNERHDLDHVAMVPQSYQCVTLMPKKGMR